MSIQVTQAHPTPQHLNTELSPKLSTNPPNIAQKAGFAGDFVHPADWQSVPQWIADKKAAGDFVELGEVNNLCFAELNPQIPQLIRDAEQLPGLQNTRQIFDWLRDVLHKQIRQLCENRGWAFVPEAMADGWIVRWLDHHLFKPKHREAIDRGRQKARDYIARKNGWGSYSLAKAYLGWERGLKGWNRKRAVEAQAKGSTIMVLTALGHSRHAIAARLGCDESTVRWHRRRRGQADVDDLVSLFKSEAEYANNGSENSTANSNSNTSSLCADAVSPDPSLAYSAAKAPEVVEAPPDEDRQTQIAEGKAAWERFFGRRVPQEAEEVPAEHPNTRYFVNALGQRVRVMP